MYGKVPKNRDVVVLKKVLRHFKFDQDLNMIENSAFRNNDS